MVTRNENAFAFPYVDLFSPVVENHLSRIDIIDGIFARTVYATAEVVVEEAVKYIVIIEYELHRA